MGLIDMLEPIYSALPVVKPPAVEPTLRRKLMWSAIALLLFFIMGNVTLIGITPDVTDYLQGLQTILASNLGTLISAGISPIVLASIILQLLVGGKLINIDLSDPAGRMKFQGVQKLFAIVLCFFEGIVYTASGMLQPLPGMFIPVALQIALGSLILLYLDEVVSKHGIGSGIGLFIAGGVSGTFFWQVFRPPIISEVSPDLATGGTIIQFINSLGTGMMLPALIIVLPIIVAIIIFLIIVFAEGMHVNIPITMGRRGTGGRFPVKLLYVSNIPVILAVALFANLRLWGLAVANIPIIGFVMETVAFYTTSPFNLLGNLIIQVSGEGINGLIFMAPELFHAFIYMIILIIACVIFGKFWVQMGGQGPEAVAEQLQRSGMYVPGFRRDKRIIQNILERYIPPITIMGSIFVALLAGFGDMALGTLASGTGILLTVGIVYRLYEELAREQLMVTHPLLKRFFG